MSIHQDYITDVELKNLLQDLAMKAEAGDLEQVRQDLQRTIEDTQVQERYIDRTYISEVKNRKRRTQIREIMDLLEEMDAVQVQNVHVYVTQEYHEPNHEAVALDAVIRLSRSRQENNR